MELNVEQALLELKKTKHGGVYRKEDCSHDKSVEIEGTQICPECLREIIQDSGSYKPWP